MHFLIFFNALDVKCSRRFMHLSTWSPANGTVWEGYGTFRGRSLAGGSTSLGVGFEFMAWLHFQFALFFLPVGGDVISQLPAPAA